MDTSTLPAVRTQPSWLAITATALGSALEWYDLMLYGLFAVTFSHLFFPVADRHSSLSLIASFGSFGIAMVARPLGAAWLGSYADRNGRRRGLVLSTMLMTLGTALLALMPSYATLGPVASVGIVLSRLTQGFAAGGEFGTAAAMLSERNPARRGLYSSLQWSASGISITLASFLAWLLHQVYSDAQIQAWAWRLPFLLGMALGPAITWLRLRADESPEFVRHESHLPLREILFTEKRKVVTAAVLMGLGAAGSYINVYMPTLEMTLLHMKASQAMIGTIVSSILTIIFPPLCALLGDLVDRRRLMMTCAAVGGGIAVPLFMLLVHSPSVVIGILVQSILSVIIYCGYYANVPALFAEMFQSRNRSSGIAVSYALGQLVFGGFTPMIVTILIDRFHSSIMPGIYLAIIAIPSILCVFLSRKFIVRPEPGGKK